MTNIKELLKNHILVIDGAMGTMIQRYKLDEAGYRGERFKDWHKDVKGNNYPASDRRRNSRTVFRSRGRYY